MFVLAGHREILFLKNKNVFVETVWSIRVLGKYIYPIYNFGTVQIEGIVFSVIVDS